MTEWEEYQARKRREDKELEKQADEVRQRVRALTRASTTAVTKRESDDRRASGACHKIRLDIAKRRAARMAAVATGAVLGGVARGTGVNSGLIAAAGLALGLVGHLASSTEGEGRVIRDLGDGVLSAFVSEFAFGVGAKRWPASK